MFFTRFISAVLALCVIATSGLAANMRIDSGTGQFVTICAGGQSVTVELDHTGTPIEARHHCPECISVVVLTQAPASPTPYFSEMRLTAVAVGLSQTEIPAPNATARAPPLTV